MKLRRFAKLFSALGGLVIVMALVVPSAFATTPAPGYEEFAGCPSPAEEPEVSGCFSSEVTSGHFQMGSKDVPITNPVKISAGTTPSGKIVYNSKGGLIPARQTVPGGLVGLTGLDWLVNFLNLEALKVYAKTELAGTLNNPFLEPFALPIKVHLENPVIGNNCYVGSNSNPIKLNLILGTTNPPPPNKPITGTVPSFSLDPGLPGVVRFLGATYVDNSFAAPGASGCQLNLGLIHLGIDGLINVQSGLPAAAGTNETVQNGNAATVEPKFVYP
jgi:hypothetical protein